MPLPELWPSEARRHMNHVHQSQLMAKAMRHGSQKSILRKIAQESHLLYGNASTLYVEDLANPSGERRRIDVPLMQHSVQVDLPMLSIFDPEGLELALWRLQTGKRVAP